MRVSTFALVAAGSIASVAAAQPMVSATYFDLSGDWNGALFTATAADTVALQSSGSVARLVAPVGTAQFFPGFVGDPDPADFFLSLTSLPTIDPDVRLGTGTFIITGDNGSTISGAISGEWINDAPGANVVFNGTLSGVTFVGDPFTGDTGGFSTVFGGTPPYDGAITQLFLTPPGGSGNFFTAPFAGVATGVTMQILPEPGALALIGLGGLVALRRRR